MRKFEASRRGIKFLVEVLPTRRHFNQKKQESQKIREKLKEKAKKREEKGTWELLGTPHWTELNESTLKTQLAHYSMNFNFY